MNTPRTAIAFTAALALACTAPSPTAPDEEPAVEPPDAAAAPAGRESATSGSNGDEIHACVKKGSGALYQPSGGKKGKKGKKGDNGKTEGCKKNDEEISWNREGPPGISGHEIVSGEQQISVLPSGRASAGRSITITKSCPAGKKVVGGGFLGVRAIGDLQNLEFFGSYPAAVDEWAVVFTFQGATGEIRTTLYAVCASTPAPVTTEE